MGERKTPRRGISCLGLSMIRRVFKTIWTSIAEKYQGTASFKHDGDEFYTDVVLPLTHAALQ